MESGRGRRRGRGLVKPLRRRRVVALRPGRVRGGVVEKAQVKLFRGARRERHLGRQLVSGWRAAQTGRQRLVELEHVHSDRPRDDVCVVVHVWYRSVRVFSRARLTARTVPAAEDRSGHGTAAERHDGAGGAGAGGRRTWRARARARSRALSRRSTETRFRETHYQKRDGKKHSKPAKTTGTYTIKYSYRWCFAVKPRNDTVGRLFFFISPVVRALPITTSTLLLDTNVRR